MILTLVRNPKLKRVGDGGEVPCQQLVEEDEEGGEDEGFPRLLPMHEPPLSIDDWKRKKENECQAPFQV